MNTVAIKDEPHQVPAAPLTPMGMLQIAIERGEGMEAIGKLMDFQERWERNQARKAFDAAIAGAKQEIPVVEKNRKVDFTTAKGRTNYVYEDLAEIARTVDPILARHGLSYRYRSTQEGGRLSVTCIISHRDGHSEETSLTAGNDESGNKNSIQAIGSAATYLQRYTLKLALGLAASKDDDGNAAGSDERISEKQLTELLELADALCVDKIKFCAWAKVESFADIRRTDFQKARGAILAKGKKHG